MGDDAPGQQPGQARVALADGANPPYNVSMPAHASKTRPAAQAAAAAPAQGGPPKQGDHVFLIDGSSYIFRAYHALPPLTRKSDGLQVNAVLGFCNMLWKLLRDMRPEERPSHLAVVFDKSDRTFPSRSASD